MSVRAPTPEAQKVLQPVNQIVRWFTMMRCHNRTAKASQEIFKNYQRRCEWKKNIRCNPRDIKFYAAHRFHHLIIILLIIPPISDNAEPTRNKSEKRDVLAHCSHDLVRALSLFTPSWRRRRVEWVKIERLRTKGVEWIISIFYNSRPWSGNKSLQWKNLSWILRNFLPRVETPSKTMIVGAVKVKIWALNKLPERFIEVERRRIMAHAANLVFYFYIFFLLFSGEKAKEETAEKLIKF